MKELIDLMILYSRHGLADWKTAPYQVRQRAQLCLTHAGIAENEKEAECAIREVWNPNEASRFKFIPMPKRPKKGLERCFFLPIRERTENSDEVMVFELFILVAQKNCLAFRFEPAHRRPGHDYGHVQLTKVLKKKTANTTIPEWIPDSYPAFPIGTSDPLKAFLSMAVSVHGYTHGLLDVLRDVFQEASRSSDSVFYVNRLRKMLS